MGVGSWAMAGAEQDVTRIEAFSDAVFGFAITLLVVSLEVPNSFDELMRVIRGLPVFAITFAILLMIWQEHHGLFKRFPNADGVTIWLNGASYERSENSSVTLADSASTITMPLSPTVWCCRSKPSWLKQISRSGK